MILQGNVVTLRSAQPGDARQVFEWLAQSDVTSSMLGPPLFPETQAPSWEVFCSDYQAHFFDGSRPESGRSFIVEASGEAVGHVNYDGLGGPRLCAELDVWMRSERCCGQGYGSDAIVTLVAYLEQEYGVREFVLRPSARNARAIRSYERAGFERVEMTQEAQAELYGKGDYDDSVVMRRLGAT